MYKIVTVIGARPQFIKAAPISKVFGKSLELNEILVHTGQHYDSTMSDIFFEELEIPEPKYNLGIGSGSHANQTADIMKRLEKVLLDENPDMLLIYGDTNSTLAAAITASKIHIPIAHVEAGLRSFNREMPEEINRVVTDCLSSILFSPTQAGINNLKNEGIERNVYKTGDVMYDVALWATKKAKNESSVLKKYNLEKKKYALVTIHRAENTDEKLRLINIFTALNIINKDIPLVLPLHPRTQKMLDEYNISNLINDLKVIEPVGFIDMVSLESNAALILTDSGGVQKEAYFHGVPCVTMRDQTEWVETVEAKWNILANTRDGQDILNGVNCQLNRKKREDILEYGDGQAAQCIVQKIEDYLNHNKV